MQLGCFNLLIGFIMLLRLRPAANVVSTGLTALVTLAFIMGALTFTAGAKPLLALSKPLPITVTAQPITNFSRSGRPRNMSGKLAWRGGLVLSTDSEKFGGYSGLVISADGQDLMAISDAGGWLKARLQYSGIRPTGLSDARIGSLMASDGKPLRRHRELDAEELALLSGTLSAGEVLVSFENVNRITRYPVTTAGLGRPLEIFEPPPGLRRFSTDGMEAMTVLRGGPNKGRLVAFSENARGDGRHTGWIWTHRSAKPLHVVSHGGFSLTAAASLDDGTLILLERRFTLLDGVRMRLRRIEAADIKPGAVLDGEVLIEADLSDEIDNMEGLAVHTAPNGDTVLSLISDDNFNTVIQRTLLLQFTLGDRPQT
jgi:hypothetical protein